ncbi:MAG: FAD-dependent oxidoreductase [Coriobacteriaceae bacterium]|jgi:fumarate reductase flavoprotein subunit|nr:FAD-dependent oxidoreductase [Coriobacteriaceae bacterium]
MNDTVKQTEDLKKNGLSRRSFLTGAATLGMGAVGLGLIACASPQASEAQPGSQAANDKAAGPISETLEADMVVIGSGSTGTAAALRGAELGAKVILVEKSTEQGYGGSSNVTSGLFGLGTSVQKELGITVPSQEDYFKKSMEYHHGSFNANLFRHYMANSAETIEWYRSLGVEFSGIVLDVFHIYKTESGETREALQYLYGKAKEFGVQFEFETTVTELQTDAGKVVGALATRKNGDRIAINAPVVIIATGGFAASKALLEEFTNYRYDTFTDVGYPGRNGDGITMGRAVGANLHHPEALNTGSLVVKGAANFVGGMGGGLPVTRPEVIIVNQNGKRFMNEGFGADQSYSLNPVSLQARVYSIIDQAEIDRLINEGYVNWDKSIIKYPDLQKGIDDALANQDAEAWKADTIEGLAEQMGIDASSLKKTFDAYNKYVAAGKDPDFFKDPELLIPIETPPYYAFGLSEGLMNTVGGLQVDEQFRVIDTKGDPIPGLYAGGSDAGGLYGFNYDIDTLPGSMQGWCSTSGRLAAVDAVKNYLKLR